MGINDKVEEMVDKFRIMKERIGWKKEAKNRYKELSAIIAEKDPCDQCAGAAENICDGDTIVAVKRNPKTFCTDAWHEAAGEVQKIDEQGKKMTFIGYDNLLAGFNVTKVCSCCHRIICVKEF